MAGLHFDITGDNLNLLRKLQETEKGIKAVSQTAEKEGGNIEALFNRIAKSAAAFGAGFTAKEFVTQIAQVRGEFQKLEVAFTTMLGSKQKAEVLMTQMVRTAATTPFGLQDVASGAKQLLAYGVAAEDVNQTLIRLGDIAAGLSIPLGDLVYLYGTTRAQGRLYTEDLNQFTGRGIPMIQELAKHFGVAEGKIKDMVSEGKVGFEEVQLVIESLTNEGGKFGGLMEAQSKTISGQISNIEDAIESMFNDIGKSSENVIRDALSGVSYLVENYEKVGEAIAVAVSAYGSYKAVLMTVSAVQSANNLVLRQAVVERSLAAASGISLSNAESVATARTKLLTIAQRGLVKSLKSAAAATLANPYVLMAAAITSLTYGIYKLATYETEAEKKQRSLNEAIAESEAASLSEQRELAKLKGELSALSKGTKEYESVKDKIIKGFGKYYEELDEEINRVGLTEAAYNKLTDAIQKSYGARQYEKFSKEQQSELDDITSKSLLKIQDRLYNEFGMEQGAQLFTKLRNSVFSGKLIVGKGFSNIIGLSNELSVALDKVAGSGILQTRTIEEQLIKILKAQKAAEEVDKKAKVRFGIVEDSDKEENKKLGKNNEPKNKSYWEARKKEAESARDALDVSKKNSKEWNEYTKQIDEAQKNIDKYSMRKDYPLKDTNNLTNTQEKLNSQLLSLQRKNQQDEINLMDEGMEKKLAKINADFEAQKQAIERQAQELAKANKEAGTKGLSKDGLTAEQRAEIDKANELNAESREKAENDVYRSELEAMRNYLKEYGTYQEQKLAIAEEYAEKISKAQSEGERMSLAKQRDSAIQQVEMNALSQKIDWGAAFGDLTGLLQDQMKDLFNELKEYTKSDKFKDSSETDKKTVYDAIERIESMLPGGEGSLNFKELQQQMVELGNAVTRVRAAESQQVLAHANLQKAQENYKKAIDSCNKAEIERAKTALQLAQSASSSADNEYSDATSEMKSLAGDVKKASQDTIDGLNMVSSGLRGFASGTLQGSFEGIQSMLAGLSKLNIGGKIGDAISKISETLSSAGVIGQIVSGILSILDLLKDGIGPVISSLIDTIFNAITGILDNILSLDIFKQIGGSLVKGIGGLLNTVSFGGFNKLFGIGGNAKEVERAINRLTDRNETLQVAIEDLTDEMKASKGAKSVEAYNEAKKNQEELNKNYLQIAKEQARYHGNHGSWNHYWRGFSQSQIESFSKKIGRDWNGDIWNLSPEEMKLLRGTIDMWNQIQTSGKGGYGERLTDKLDDYIDQAGKLDELQKELFEGLTGVTFESMYDSYISTLMDMTKSAEDAADDISQYFMQAMLSNAIGEQMYDKFKAWYDKFAEYMKEDGLSEEERNNLLNGNKDEGIIGWNDIIKEGFELRDELAAATGYDKVQSHREEQQSASGKGFESMGQDTADELNGRFTALYEVGLQILQNISILQTISVSTGECNATLLEIRNLMISSNGYLEDISVFVKKILEGFGEKLDNINTNIKNGLQ